MLTCIRNGLRLVPFELELSAMQALLSRRDQIVIVAAVAAVGNGGQCGTGFMADAAFTAAKNLQLAGSIGYARVRIPLSPPN